MAALRKCVYGFGGVLALLTLILSAASAQDLILNGGFEKGPDGGDSRLDPGSHAIEGWTVIRGSIDYVNDDWTSFDGKHCIDLEGEAAFGGVVQTIPTEPGRVYTVRFDLAGNPDGEPRIKKMRVEAAGQSTERWFDSQGRTRHDLGWQTHQWQFLAVGFENSGIVMRIGAIEKRVLNVDIGPSDKASKADKFRLSIESRDADPDGIAK